MKSSGDEVKAFFTENRKKIPIITKIDSPLWRWFLALADTLSALEKPPSMVATFFIGRFFATTFKVISRQISLFSTELINQA